MRCDLLFDWSGSEEGGPLAHCTTRQQQPSTQVSEKGFLQRLKDVFWKSEETEPQVKEVDQESQKMK